MKNSKNIVVIVLVAAVLVIVGAVTYQAMVVAPRAAEQQNVLKQYNFPGNVETQTAPANGFSQTGLNVEIAPTETPDTGSDPEINYMLQKLQEAPIDDGSIELRELESEAEGL